MSEHDEAQKQERTYFNREPICPKCWAIRIKRQVMLFDDALGIWRCSAKDCGVIVIDPDEPDGRFNRADIEALIRQPTERERQYRAECRYPNGDRAPQKKPGSHGGSKSGRSRKKQFPKGRRYTPEEDAAITQKHNANVQRKKREGRV